MCEAPSLVVIGEAISDAPPMRRGGSYRGNTGRGSL